MEKHTAFEDKLMPNTKSVTLGTLCRGLFHTAGEIGEGNYVSYRLDVEAEEIRFSTDAVTATIWRPGLDVANTSINWKCPWDPGSNLRLRMFFKGSVKPFRFDGLTTETIEIDMHENGELRPVFYDPRGTRFGQPLDEATLLKLFDSEVTFSAEPQI